MHSLFFYKYASKVNFHNTIFMLQNHRCPDSTCINNDYINVIDSTKCYKCY